MMSRMTKDSADFCLCGLREFAFRCETRESIKEMLEDPSDHLLEISSGCLLRVPSSSLTHRARSSSPPSEHRALSDLPVKSSNSNLYAIFQSKPFYLHNRLKMIVLLSTSAQYLVTQKTPIQVYSDSLIFLVPFQLDSGKTQYPIQAAP